MAERLEKTQHPGIKYKPDTDTYVVYLDFGRRKVLDEKTGTYKIKRDQRRIAAKNLKEALKIQRDHKSTKEQGQSVLSGKSSHVTLLEACEDFLNHNKGKWSTSYMIRQRTHMNRLQAWIVDTGQEEKPIREITALDLERLYSWSQVERIVKIPVEVEPGKYRVEKKKVEAIAYNTLNKLESFLRNLFAFCMKDFGRYGVDRDLTRSAEMTAKKTHFVPEIYTQEELNNLIRYTLDFEVKEKAGAPVVMLALCALCGLRRGELAGAKWKDITEKDGVSLLHITRQRQRVQTEPGKPWVEIECTPKGGDDSGQSPQDRKERYAACPEVAIQLLQIVKQEQMKYRTVKDDDYIYQDPESLLTGVDPNSKTISKRWGQFLQRYRRRTGDNIKGIRLHDLRHTNADICREGGVDMFGIAYHLGHSLIGVNTFRYLHDDGLYGRKEICEAVNNSIKTEIKRHDFNNK